MVRPSNPTQSAQERQWLALLRTGNVQAFEDIYANFAPALYSFAQRSVLADVAEDIVQDVFIDLWERRDTITVRSGLKSYLLGAAWRKTLHVHRRNRIDARARERVVQEQGTRGMGYIQSPDTDTEAREAERAIAEAVAGLPERAQLVLALRWNDNLTYEQVGEVLGISDAAAKKQGQRAEQALRAILQRFA